ncbi:MAG: SLATT domain-containing protein [Cyanobacteria bacterium J06634_6]
MKISVEELLESWYRRLRNSQFAHYESAKSFARIHYWLGIPSVLLSTLIGTSIFATLGESVETNLRLAAGLVSVLAAGLTSLQTFLKLSEKSEKHRSAAARYGSLRREIEELLSLQSLNESSAASLREAIDRLAEESPSIPNRDWSKAQKKLASNRSSFLVNKEIHKQDENRTE